MGVIEEVISRAVEALKELDWNPIQDGSYTDDEPRRILRSFVREVVEVAAQQVEPFRSGAGDSVDIVDECHAEGIKASIRALLPSEGGE